MKYGSVIVFIGKSQSSSTSLAPLLSATLALLVFGSGGCNHKPSPAPDVVIDAHTHVFNAHYLPIQNIAIAQWGMSQPLAQAAEILLWDLTDDADLGGTQATTNAFARSARGAHTIGELSRLTMAQSREFVVKETFEARMSVQRVQRLVDTSKLSATNINALKIYLRGQSAMTNAAVADKPLSPAEIATFFERIRLLADRPRSSAQHSAAISTGAHTEALGVTGDLSFIRIITSDERSLFAGLRNTYPEVSLFVHHMMDLEHTYHETPKIPFSAQLSKLLALQDENPGSLLTFGAFDPFRRDDALAAATSAYAKGAIGFKFYPPDGYRPANNVFPPADMPGTIADQYDSRYKGISPANIDHWNEQFFSFCVSNDVPIFVHCSEGGFEAVAGYGTNMANPAFWSEVLAKHPKLRMCFGHSGGNDLWFGRAPDTSSSRFGTNIAQLCSTFDNVYCDSAYWQDLLEKGGVNALETQLPKLLTEYPRLAKKLVYGSDWYMVSREDGYGKYLHLMVEALQHPKGTVPPNWDRFVLDFFASNEARYLRLDKLASDKRLSHGVQTGLAALIKRLPPGWEQP